MKKNKFIMSTIILIIGGFITKILSMIIKISKYIQLEEKLKKYIKNEEELNEIKKSFEFANIKHNGQKRNSGEDYIIHP